jgi:hypothetical protein
VDSKKPWCCFPACGKDAEFDIWGSCSPEDNLQACEEHVGALLSQPASWQGAEARHWRVSLVEVVPS